MEKKTGNNKGNVIGKILRRPIVRIALILVVIIVAIIIIASNAGSKKTTSKLVGYQRLVNVTDDTYTFLDLDGKVRKYSGF